jgi:hypothetical protein
MANFAILTKNVRDSKHIAAIQEVFERHGVKATLQYKFSNGKHIGAGLFGPLSDEGIADVRSLSIPQSAKLGWK